MFFSILEKDLHESLVQFFHQQNFIVDYNIYL